MMITDRRKDLIKSGGEWISSVALENALMVHSGVKEAAVVAVPDEKWGERPLALIVPEASRSPNREELRAIIAKDFPRYCVPERIELVTEIPKTSVGKIDKKVIRKEYSGRDPNEI